MDDPAEELLGAVREACDHLHCNEGYVELSFVRDPGPSFTFQFYDYDVERRWEKDGGDPEDPPSTVMPTSMLRRLLEVTAELGVECTLRADLVDACGTDAFEVAYGARLLERA